MEEEVVVTYFRILFYNSVSRTEIITISLIPGGLGIRPRDIPNVIPLCDNNNIKVEIPFKECTRHGSQRCRQVEHENKIFVDVGR
jgi:hypothetical protein